VSAAEAEQKANEESPSHLLAAVVGTGFIGPVHVEALRRLGRPVAGILASTPEKGRRAAERLNVTRWYESLDELLADPMISVIHLASPNHLHYEQCGKVLTAGKHLLCEKPLALTSQQTGDLVERSARPAAPVAGVCYNVRFYPLCQELRRRIQDGQIGTVYHVTGSYVQDWLLHETDFNWRVLPGEGGSLRAVADIGTHWLDLVTWMTGLEVAELCSDLRTFLPVRQRPLGSVETFRSKLGVSAATEPVSILTEDFGSVLLRFRGGASGTMTVSQVSAGRKNCLRLEIAGSKGALAWDSERPNELWTGRRDAPNELLVRDPALLHPAVRRWADYPGGHNEGFPDTFKQLFKGFYEYIEAGDRQAQRPFPTFVDGHREALLCEAILASHRERRWAPVSS
jgi:predicted dehydrogenase